MSVQDNGRAKVKELVERFAANRDEYSRASSDYNETQLRIDFLNPFLQALGWDVLNEKHAPQHLREVVHEAVVQVDEDKGLLSKKPDYAFRAGQERKFFLEAKKPAVPVLTNSKAAFQVRRYGWNARMPISVLTNFDKLVIYDCSKRPDYNDDATRARLKVYNYTEYVDKFDEIYNQLSREAVFSGTFDKLFSTNQQHAGTERFDQYFLNQIERWRRNLAEDLITHNPTLTQEELNFLAQRLINRIIFLRVCEDRELEKYESLKKVKTYQELKKIFAKADERYNSGLFDFIEDKLSLKVELGSDVLVHIFQELYFPESPYAFSVVETDVISEIYEIFLGKALQLGKDGQIRVVEKPEVVASNGVVSTPEYIVDEIVQRALTPVCQGKSPAELSHLRIADIACGSGTFLLSAYEYLLNYHLDWYINDGAEKHTREIYEGTEGNWYLTLHEKRRILLQNIYGVDIDIQAVEVTQFSLLLKVLENETATAVSDYIRTYKLRALPGLTNNVQWGNSLVDPISYHRFDTKLSTDRAKFMRINPFNWNQSFQQTMQEGGFDVIVGNPPYIRIQNMVRYSPDEVRYYKSPLSPYTTAKKDNFDKYALFIERSSGLLKPSGRLGYIVPHKFFKIQAGTALRQLITDHHYLSEIVDFGVQQVFQGQTTTYTCILILNMAGSEQVLVEHVSDLNKWRYNQNKQSELLDANMFNEKPWLLLPAPIRALFDRLQQQNSIVLKDVCDIFVGLQTSCDDVYIIHPESETDTLVHFKDLRGNSWTIERTILRACLYDAEVKAFSKPIPNAYVIFPYLLDGSKARLYSEEEMQQRFPLCWKYLNAHKSILMKRNIENYTPDTWYKYGRRQSLNKFDGQPKLIWPTLSLEARYAYDDNNLLFTGGGNGPYYALKERNDSDLSLYYFLAILSHPVFDYMIQTRASQFRGDYRSYGKQFIENIPIRTIDLTHPGDKSLYESIVEYVQQLLRMNDDIANATLHAEQTSLSRQAELLKQHVHQLVEKLYGISGNDIKLIKDLETANN